MIETCGVFLFVGREFLACHPTHGPWNSLTIPKGLPEPGETRLATALRELEEETGIRIHEASIVGSFRYLKQDKILHAFIAKLPIKPSDLRCRSMVIAKGKEFPEVDSYRWIGPESASLLHHTQQEALREILSRG